MIFENERRTGQVNAHSEAGAKAGRRFGGSSWLITYADLMTILVCFFVLIVSFSIQDQVKLEVVAGSMRNAFGVAEERRYAGDVKSTGTPDQRQPGNVKPSPTPTGSAISDSLSARATLGTDGLNQGPSTQLIAQQAEVRQQLASVEKRLRDAITSHPLLRSERDQIRISVKQEGIQLLLVDRDGAPMFATGSSEPTEKAQKALAEIARILAPYANQVMIEGHADASGRGRYSPFELTADRANRAREILEASGLRASRIAGITGRGAADFLYPDDPYAAGNRRIEILVLPAAPLLPPDRSL